jgi:cytochrome c-type biogenesis protein
VLAVLGALVAGALTTLAPCVLPLLPVIVGGSISDVVDEPTAGRWRGPAVIVASLGLSVVVFTLLLKASTALIGVPPQVWQWVSGGLLVVLGLAALFPLAWDAVGARLGLQARSSARMTAARRHEGLTGDILTGAALGPVFTSCSPLYGYVVVTVLPADAAYGLLLLVAYAVGLCGTLLVIAVGGQSAVRRLGWAADPHGWVRRTVGAAFVVVGVLVLTGVMKDLETWLIVHSPVRPWQLDQGFVPD